jgi:hypothetical protein
MTFLTTPSLTDSQTRLLRTFFAEGGLTTSLLNYWILPSLDRRSLLRELARLRDQGLITGQALGTTGEFCWWLTYDGARALGHAVRHGEARYRAPNPTHLAQKPMVFQLLSIFQMMSWQYVRPAVYNPGHPKPDDTPQRLAIYRAVEAHFQRIPPGSDVPRLHPSHVPNGLNDWVAWPATAPPRAVVLILHPAGGTPHFWHTRARRASGRPVGALGRTQIYADVAGIVPVIGVFPTRELVADYAPLLRPAGLHAWWQEELIERLHNYHIGGRLVTPARP